MGSYSHLSLHYFASREGTVVTSGIMHTFLVQQI